MKRLDAERVAPAIRALTAVLMVAALLLVATRSTAAQRDDSGAEENSYRGENYDWSVEWDEDVWKLSEDDTSGGTDYLMLESLDEDDFALVVIIVQDDDDDTADCLDFWFESLEQGGGIDTVELSDDLETLPLPEDGTDAAYTYEVTNGDVAAYAQCRLLEDGSATALAVMTTTSGGYDDWLAEFDPLLASLDGVEQPAADGDDDEVEGSGVDGSTFNGVNFDWSVEWDEDVWEVLSEDNTGGSDYLSLDTVDDSDVVLALLVQPPTGGDSDECLDEYGGLLADLDGVSDVEEADDLERPAAPRDGAATVFTYEQERDGESQTRAVYVQCRPVDEQDAILVAALTVDLRDYDDVLPLAMDVVDTIEAGRVSNAAEDEVDADETDDEADAASGVEGNTFTGVNFDWAMSWDESDWELVEEDNSLGTDFIALGLTGESDVSFSFEALPSTFEDMRQCALRALDLVDRRDGVTNIQVTERLDGPPVTRDGAALTYTFDYGDEAAEYAGFVACLELEDGAVLLITFGGEATEYDEALVVAIDVLESIEVDGDLVRLSEAGDGGDQAYVTGIDGDTYTSPTYGYSVEWDSDVWTARRTAEIVDGAPHDVDQLALERMDGNEVLTRLWIEGAEGDDDLEGCVAAQADAWVDSGSSVEIHPLEDRRGDPIAGETAGNGYFAAYESVIVNAQGEEIDAVIHIECQALVEGESVLVLTTLTTPDGYEDDLELVEDVTGSIDLDEVARDSR